MWLPHPVAQVLPVIFLHLNLPRVFWHQRHLLSQRTVFLCLQQNPVLWALTIEDSLSESSPSVGPYVESYLTWPRVDSQSHGFSENISYVSDLLKLSKRKLMTQQVFVSEQLLSAEAESRIISSLPPLLSVSHLLRETNHKIQGSEDTKVLKHHKGCLPACHKGLVGFIHCLHTGSTIKFLSPPPRWWMLTMTYRISQKCGFHQGFRV